MLASSRDQTRPSIFGREQPALRLQPRNRRRGRARPPRWRAPRQAALHGALQEAGPGKPRRIRPPPSQSGRWWTSATRRQSRRLNPDRVNLLIDKPPYLPRTHTCTHVPHGHTPSFVVCSRGAMTVWPLCPLPTVLEFYIKALNTRPHESSALTEKSVAASPQTCPLGLHSGEHMEVIPTSLKDKVLKRNDLVISDFSPRTI